MFDSSYDDNCLVNVVALGIVGDCRLLLNPFGPLQLYDVIPPGPPVS